MNKDIQAVIFDADGTILDTRELVFQAYRHIFTEHGYEMPPMEELVRFGGRPTNETYAHFAKNHDSAMLQNKHREFQESQLDLFSAYEGFDELMAKLKKAGLKIGICTNRASNVLMLLKRIDIQHHFDAIIHADLVENFKPHPEGILKVCQMMRVDPKKSVMVGDTEADIGAGKAADCAMTIGITHGIGTRELLEEHGADAIVDQLNDIAPLLGV